MEKTLEQIKKHLANLPDRCQLIEEYAEELLTDDEIKKAESCLVDVYNGDLGIICLILSSNCAPFLFLFEDQPEMIDDIPKLLNLLSFAIFSVDFEDLDDEEKEEVKEEAKQILNKSLSILEGGGK